MKIVSLPESLNVFKRYENKTFDEKIESTSKIVFDKKVCITEADSH